MTLIKEFPCIIAKEVISVPIEAKTGLEFDEMIIVTIETKEGFIDFLFDKQGELVKPGRQDKIVQELTAFFNKSFIKSTFDNTHCWCQIIRL